MKLVPAYRRRASALHSARAGAASVYCLAFVPAALVTSNPIVLAGIVAGLLLAGAAAGVSREQRRWLWLSIPFGVLVVGVNALVSQRGLTVVLRAGTLPGGHRLDVTAESLAWGGVTALRIVCVFLATGLQALVVDPDELMRLLRRVSYRSALTASLATRLVPVLARDATRMSDAARCRPRAPGRLELMRATLAGALDRAIEVAAALEVRGYASARPPRGGAPPWSRHDVRVGVGALVVVVLAVVATRSGTAAFQADPVVTMSAGPGTLLLAAAFALAGLVPFAGAGARLGVARA